MKKILSLIILILLTSALSSSATWFILTHRSPKEVSWKQTLQLTQDQEQKFSEMESKFELVLKEMEIEEAQNKISLCSYLHSGNMTQEKIDRTAKQMSKNYEEKQKKIASTLIAITNFLTPKQQKIFSSRLMHDICVSCRHATGIKKCLCGSCEMR